MVNPPNTSTESPTSGMSSAVPAGRPTPRRRGWSRRDQLVHVAWATADCLLVILATFVSAWLRYDLDLRSVLLQPTALFAIVAAAIYLAFGVLIGSYRIGHVRGSFEETADIARAVVATVVPLVLILLLTDWFHGVPRSLGVLVPALALVAMFTLRFVVRSYRWGRGELGAGVRKSIVFGAGLSGRQLVRALRNDPGSKYAPVAMLDDDPRKRRLRIDGLRVSGGREAVLTTAMRTGAAVLIIAIPSADSQLINELRELAADADLEVLLLPPTDQRIGSPAVTDLRHIDLEDLLGRRRIELDTAAISGSIRGKTVLVTGAGGSIGSELARQIARFEPRKLILLDRDESALHAVQLSLTGRAMLDDGTLALVSIRDLAALHEVFERERPELVFHAAALKHLTLLEQYPLEAWKTNVMGTLNVLRAADAAGVSVFVNVSTDKAANPSCILGYSKRLAERLTAHFANQHTDRRFVSVRFGNVLGSRGSVIGAFTAQIERGGPITVTHPDVERYFMLIPEASQLVLQASVIGRDGEVMVLKMGQPVRILDVAKTLMELSGRRDVEVEFTGLRPGEKLSEELFAHGEDIRTSAHPLVNAVDVEPLAPIEVVDSGLIKDDEAYRWMMNRAVDGLEMHAGGNADAPAGSLQQTRTVTTR